MPANSSCFFNPQRSLKWNIAVLLEQSAPCWPLLPSKWSAFPCTNTPLQVCIAGSALVARVWLWGWAGWASAPRAPIMHWWIDCCTAASVSVPWPRAPRLRKRIPAMAPAAVPLLCTACRGHWGLAARSELPWPTYCCHTPGDTMWGQAGRCMCVWDKPEKNREGETLGTLVRGFSQFPLLEFSKLVINVGRESS